MAEQMRPANPEQAPDPSDAYERAHPEREAGMGRMDNNKATPQNQPDGEQQAVTNKQKSDRQVNAQETAVRIAPEQPDHSMHDEEPPGWDQAPTDIHDDRQKRHPRTDGRGGTP